jgi:hypothetical protein
MAWASSSLPVPVSPSSSTGLDDCAARRAWRLTSDRRRAGARQSWQRCIWRAAARRPCQRAAALAGQLAPRIVQVALQQRKLGDQRLQRGLGVVEQHDANGADHPLGLVAQRNAADHKGAGRLDSRSISIGWPVSSTRRIWVLGITSDTVMADKLVHRREPQGGQKALVLVVDPDDAALAVHQQHALAGAGEQLEHGARRQLQNALRIPRQSRGDAFKRGMGMFMRAMLPRRRIG